MPGEDELGVDLTLIDEMLALTPSQRLEVNDRMVATILALRASFEQREDEQP